MRYKTASWRGRLMMEGTRRVGRQVERKQSPDGKHLLRIFGRGESCFYFVELSEVVEREETFWTTTRTSEEFHSLESARKAALLALPWLRETG